MKIPRQNRAGAVATVQDAFAAALALHRRGQIDEAEQAYRAILKSHHRHFDAAHLLGLLYLNRGETEAAERQIGRALKFAPPGGGNPNVAEACNNHGLALMQLRRFDEALASFEKALALAPGHAKALANRPSALFELDRFEDTLSACDAAIALRPDIAAVWFNRGKVFDALGQLDEAIASFSRAIELEPDFHTAFHARSNGHFLGGDFARGWSDAEHRWQTPGFAGSPSAAAISISAARDDVVQKRVLVLAEQGAGDEIMYAGMIPDLMRDAASVALECDSRLIGLFARSFPGLTLIPRTEQPAWDAGAYDVVLSAGGLGRLYRASPEAFPIRERYLAHDPAIAAAWKARLPAGLRAIGLSWSGGPDAAQRRRRSIGLQTLAARFAGEGVQLVSLQFRPSPDEIAAANRILARPILCFEPAEIDDFDQLAGLAAALDEIVSVQNTLVHLCGATGMACHVPSPRQTRWYYGCAGSKMSWYESVRLYRQDRAGEWGDVLNRIARVLEDGSADAA